MVETNRNNGGGGQDTVAGFPQGMTDPAEVMLALIDMEAQAKTDDAKDAVRFQRMVLPAAHEAVITIAKRGHGKVVTLGRVPSWMGAITASLVSSVLIEMRPEERESCLRFLFEDFQDQSRAVAARAFAMVDRVDEAEAVKAVVESINARRTAEGSPVARVLE